ncbi:MAG: prepilin-type N-terminal cleavage/methylation domain-containing protein [Lachnospiraceae bacterium]|nr:prepilin-type N-terminal cleavage/methylation domain-containing protein [Lachnospiraceae bacterium]
MEFARGEKNNRGFSLIELVVVIAIMAILVGVLAPAYLQYVEKARRRVDDSAAGEIKHAAENVVFSGGFQLDNGDVLVTFNSSGISVVQGDLGNALEKMLTSDFGDLSKVVPTSKLRKAQTYTIEIQEDATTGNPKVVGAWDGPDD